MAKYVFVELDDLTSGFSVDYKPSMNSFEIQEFIDNYGYNPEVYSIPVVRFPSGITVESCNPDKLSFSALNEQLINELEENKITYEIY